MFSLICVWINGWVNNREAGDVRRYCAHYDVTLVIMENLYTWKDGLYTETGRLSQSETEMGHRVFKDRAHLSTFKIFIFEKFSCSIVLVVFFIIVQSSDLISVWLCEKLTFFPNFFSYHIFVACVGGASLGMPTACRLIAVSGARLPSVDGLVVRCIKMHHHVKSAITICLQFI